jgi:hypothetical protein
MADYSNNGRNSDASSLGEKTAVGHQSHRGSHSYAPGTDSNEERKRREINMRIANPLGGYSAQELGDMGEKYCRENQLGDDEDIRAFRLGAQVAKDPLKHAEVDGLTDEEKTIFQDEVDHKWRQPRLLYLVIVLCSTCAAVQGMGK